ncbi:MAG TPA: hypothetical protein VGR13_01165 [Actinomycetota bacterium]|nr:hypothetical protein [Actinomycetota bacterium]
MDPQQPVLVIAGNYRQALDWARWRNIPRPRVRYIHDSQGLRGLAPGTVIYAVGEQTRAAGELRDEAMAQGFDVREDL